jgi:ABC-2 type transport system permease protein
MNGFLAFLGKEAMEIRRTWRLWVLPGLLLFFGATSAAVAELTPALVKSATSDQPGVVIHIPEPVPLDAYQQWTDSLSQIVLIALVIASADMIAGERRSGTVILVVTKPISRAAFVLVKVTAQAALVGAATVIGTAACWLGTRLVFGTAPVDVLVEAVALWLLVALLLIGAMALLSVVVPAQAGAAGAGIAVYAALALLPRWGPAKAASPAGLYPAINDLLHGHHDALTWPVMTGLIVTALCILAAIELFDRQELSHSG